MPKSLRERRRRDPDGLEQQRRGSARAAPPPAECARWPAQPSAPRPPASSRAGAGGRRRDARPARPGTPCARGRGGAARLSVLLGDRVGDQRQRLAAHHGCRRRFDRRDDGRVAACSRADIGTGQTGRRIGKCRRRLRQGWRSCAIGTCEAERTRARSPAHPGRRRGRRAAAPCATARSQLTSAISGPMPAGSPIVTAIGTEPPGSAGGSVVARRCGS